MRHPHDESNRFTFQIFLAIVLAAAAGTMQHAARSTGWHLPTLALDIALALPFAGAAAWVATRVASARRLGPAGTAAVAAIGFAVLSVPLAVLQSVGHMALGQAMAHHGTAALPATDLVGLLGYGVQQAMIAQPAVLVAALGGVAAVEALRRYQPRPRPVRRTVAMSSSVVFVAGTLLVPAGVAAAQPESVEAVAASTACEIGPRRTYTVNAINVDITVNRFGDHDPFGFMYVLNDKEDEVRAQEAALRAAATSTDANGAKVSTGLGQDPIQPLVLRARLGECVVIDLHNKLTAPPRGGPGNGTVPVVVQPGPAGQQVPSVSIDMQGAPYDAAGGAGGEAIGNNPSSQMAAPGQRKQYRYFLDPLMGEGARVFRSGGDSNQLTMHGLFGTLIAEPAGARWFDPMTGADQTDNPNWSNWEAMISVPNQPSFREFGIIYHEIGDENFNMRRPQRETGQAGVGADPDGNGSPVPMIDTGAPRAGSAGSGGGTNVYRPSSRALNYRSEAHWRRLQILGMQGADLATLQANESLAYSSYMFGDPSTPMPRSYVGEPTKTRLVHAGAEQLHVHHLHGGATRWRQNPRADNTDMASGLRKVPIQNATSIRLDSQTIGPEESYNLEHECGAGGCQASAADFLFHCHIAHHYIAGMWAFWRVFDTRQANLAALPGRGLAPAAVNSTGLIGKTIEGKRVIATGTPNSDEVLLSDLVERQLPPPGARFHNDDATVWDWQKSGPASAPVYLGEPEDTAVWANYASPTPGARPQILFNPNNGRPAWPMMRPHLGKRPPFSPNGHSGAPYLGDTASQSRPDGLCPSTSAVKNFGVTAIGVPIQNTVRERDTNGMVFVLNEDKDRVIADATAGTRYPDPLAIRSNVGDCVALTFASELPAASQAKVNMHTHFVQFDPQASDGVISGFAYEQSIFNASREGRTLTAAGSGNRITVSNVTNLRPGISIGVGVGRANLEIRKITAISGNQLTLDSNLSGTHAVGEPVTVEFVQYRWYSDVDSGTVFWHDHVDGIDSWAHGLFGAHIIEPPGSTYHDPRTGNQVRSGTLVDIRTSGSVAAGQSGAFREFVLFLHNGRRGRPEVAGDNRNFGQECEEGSINLRAAPVGERTPPAAGPAPPPLHAANPDINSSMQRFEFNGEDRCRNAFLNRTIDPTPQDPNNVQTVLGTVTTVDPYVFSSVKYGDPMTPLLRAYTGDPVMIRTIGVVERNEGLRIQGHRFRMERFNTSGQLMDAATTGISERFDYLLDGGAGGPARIPGDYLYHSTRTFAFESGAWGLFRVHDKRQTDLQPLPNRTPQTGSGFPRLTAATGDTQARPGPNPPPAFRNGEPDTAVVTSTASPCPSGVRQFSYDITVFNKALPSEPFSDVNGVVYALTSDVAAIRAGTKPVEPLVLRVNRGDCVTITLRNQVTAGSVFGGTRAGFDLSGKLVRNPQLASGGAIGLNPDTTVPIGGSISYRYHADAEVGTSVFTNLGSLASLRHGGYGLLIVEPRDSTWSNSTNNAPLGANATSSQAIIRTATNRFREFALSFHTTDQQYARSIIPYTDMVAGTGINTTDDGNPRTADKGFNHVNYATEPLTVRLGLTDFPDRPDTNPNPKANYGLAFSSAVHGPPATPTMRAYAGDPVVFRVAAPTSDQFHTFTVAGHMYPLEPNMWNGTTDRRSALLTSRAITAGETLDAELVGGAGGPPGYDGDYMYRDGRQPFNEAGLWGIFRVHRNSTALPDLARL
jgi:hypothetical protein